MAESDARVDIDHRLFDDDDTRWHAVAANDARADGQFVYAVVTTGIYCRPSCRSRRPHRSNVAFFSTPNAAEDAGYRACKRCAPQGGGRDARHAEAIARACRLIERAEAEPSLDELAAVAGVSRYHFHRLFRRLVGVTPKAYARTIRNQRLRARLDEGHTMTDAIHAAGYGSSSRFYADADEPLGMSPADYRRGGADLEIRVTIRDCSLGLLLVAASPTGVCDIRFGDDADALFADLRERFPAARLDPPGSDLDQRVDQVVAAIESSTPLPELPMDIRGTAFQRRVWEALRAIPSGSTATYTEIAERIGSPSAARAVAGACAANQIAVAIPCHRVVRSDGSLSGYRWGVERKRALLEHERDASPPDPESR